MADGRWLYSTSLSGTLPESLCRTGLSALDFHSCFLQAAPALAACTSVRTLDLSNNELVALPQSLPPSLTHLYVNGNPLEVTAASLSAVLAYATQLAALDIQFLSAPLFFYGASDPSCLISICNGPRVSAPGACVLGNTSVCRWTLQMYDAYDQPCHVGGKAENLTLGMGCNDGLDSCQHTAPMADQRNGSFVAAVGVGWVRSQGRVAFRFFHQGEEFKPWVDGSSQAAGGSCQGDDCYYDALRTVDFQPRTDCSTHSRPDATGYACECELGYKREQSVNGSQAASCIPDCRGGRVNVDGACACPSRSYDPTSSGGVLRCAPFAWDAPDPTAVAGDGCLACPECAQCEGGRVQLARGWRFADDATDGAVLTAFRCPYVEVNSSGATCPAMMLPVAAQPACRDNHIGELCAICQPHFSRHTSSDNRCESCSADSYAEAVFGISRVWFAVAAVLVALSLGAALWYVRQRLLALKVLVYVHVRILLGWAQVLSLLSGVLDIVYPPHARTALGVASLVVADLRGFVRLDCLGWTWYAKWLTMIFGLPCLLLALIGLRFGWSKRQQHGHAKTEAIGACFFVAMLLYPQLSSTIFSALRCRRLGPATSVLEVDYSVYCSDAEFTMTRVLALALVVVVPLGFPLMLLGLLWRQRRSTDDLRRSIAQQRIAEAYGFCVDDYRPDCWYFEPLDMLRKLALTGLLQFVQRGTATQVFCGCGLAFLSSGVQLRLQPYRETEANVLKTLVDAQLFLTFLLSFLLRVLPRLELQEYEPLSVGFYGWVLLLSVVGLLVAAVGLTARRIRRAALPAISSPLLDIDARTSDSESADVGGAE
jgi:hypothetical protein